MPLTPVWEPDAEALDRTRKLRVSTRQLEQLDLAVAEFNMARSWILRECVALGFPLFVEQVRQRRRAGWFRAGSIRIRMWPVRGVALARMAGVPIGGSVLRFDVVEEAVGGCRIGRIGLPVPRGVLLRCRTGC